MLPTRCASVQSALGNNSGRNGRAFVRGRHVMITISGILQLAAAALVAATMSAVAAQAATFKLKIGAGHPHQDYGSQPSRMCSFRASQSASQKRPATRSNGPRPMAARSASSASASKLVKSGLLDIADVHVPTEPAKLLAHNFMFFVPFGTSDPRLAARQVGAELSTPALKKVLEERYNQIFVGPGIVGNYGLVTNFKWTNVSELRGRKIAVDPSGAPRCWPGWSRSRTPCGAAVSTARGSTCHRTRTCRADSWASSAVTRNGRVARVRKKFGIPCGMGLSGRWTVGGRG